jgi:hypothetical protein
MHSRKTEITHVQKLCVQQLLALITAFAVFGYVMPRPADAASHVVNLAELQQELIQSHNHRAQDLADIGRVLELPAAQDALAKVHLEMPRVEAAIASLNDAELSRLAVRARAVEQEVQGGIIVGLLALIGLVVVVIVVLTVIRAND